MTHVLVATDGASSAQAALRFTAELLSSDHGKHITVLDVAQPSAGRLANPDMALVPQATWNALAAQAHTDAERVIEEARATLTDFGGSVTVVHRHGQRAAQILDTARELSADLIVVGAAQRKSR